MLWNAVERAGRSEIAVYVVVVDAKGAQAVSFYRHHGLVPFGDSLKKLLLPLKKR